MGPTGAYKLQVIRSNCIHVMAIELLHAAQAIDMNEGLRLSPITQEIHDDFRKHVTYMTGDRIVAGTNTRRVEVYDHDGSRFVLASSIATPNSSPTSNRVTRLLS